MTLLELLIVIAIIGILSAFAVMRFNFTTIQFERQENTRLLKAAFERARFDSVKRRAENINTWASVAVTSNSFTLTIDQNMNGVMTDANDSIVTSFAGQNITITGMNSLSIPVTVYFNQRGEVVNNSGTTISPAFLVCNGTCSSDNDTSSNANIILVTPTGTVNMLPGGSNIPNFTPPGVTSVPANSHINTDVTVTY
jgi:prepilin-type N-terminal cleavage/methylation domain-containing protein